MSLCFPSPRGCRADGGPWPGLGSEAGSVQGRVLWLPREIRRQENAAQVSLSVCPSISFSWRREENENRFLISSWFACPHSCLSAQAPSGLCGADLAAHGLPGPVRLQVTSERSLCYGVVFFLKNFFRLSFKNIISGRDVGVLDYNFRSY